MNFRVEDFYFFLFRSLSLWLSATADHRFIGCSNTNFIEARALTTTEKNETIQLSLINIEWVFFEWATKFLWFEVWP